MFERILSVKDACRCDKAFWKQREFNLIPINREGDGEAHYLKKVGHKAVLDNKATTDKNEQLAGSLKEIPAVGT